MSFAPDHLHYRATDAEATARFFVDMFGAEETGRAPQPSGALRVMLKLGALPIFVEGVPAGTAAPPPAPFLGLEHLGLTVPDMDAAVAGLKAKGVRFTLEPKQVRPGVRIAFLEGPDGAIIELIERR